MRLRLMTKIVKMYLILFIKRRDYRHGKDNGDSKGQCCIIIYNQDLNTIKNHHI